MGYDVAQYMDSTGKMTDVGPSTPLPATLGTLLAGEDQTNNLLRTSGQWAEMGSLSAGALNADLVPSTDVSLYKHFGIQVNGTFSGTLTVQGCNDNATWQTLAVVPSTLGPTGAVQGTITATGLFDGRLSCRYLRIRMTAYTSGTATGVLELYTAAAV